MLRLLSIALLGEALAAPDRPACEGELLYNNICAPQHCAVSPPTPPPPTPPRPAAAPEAHLLATHNAVG